MKFFMNILRREELKLILSEGQDQSNVSVGIVSAYDPKKVISLMELWCSRVDSIVELDIEVNGKPSKNAQYLNYHRGFTYLEFLW